MEAPAFVLSLATFLSKLFITTVEEYRQQLHVRNAPFFKLTLPADVVATLVMSSSRLPNRPISATVTKLEELSPGLYYRRTKTGKSKRKSAFKHLDNMHNRDTSNWQNNFDLAFSRFQLAGTTSSYIENITFSIMDQFVNAGILKPDYNFDKLDTFLRSIPKNPIDGVTRSMIYIGEKGTTSPMHVEDALLGSCNYLMAGSAPKLWLGVAASDGPKLAKAVASKLNNGCINPLLHRDISVDIEFLRENGIPYFTLVQNPGDIVITNPGGWHQIANAGTNVAEAVNLDLTGWTVVARRMIACHCTAFIEKYMHPDWQSIFTFIKEGERSMFDTLYGNGSGNTTVPNGMNDKTGTGDSNDLVDDIVPDVNGDAHEDGSNNNNGSIVLEPNGIVGFDDVSCLAGSSDTNGPIVPEPNGIIGSDDVSCLAGSSDTNGLIESDHSNLADIGVVPPLREPSPDLYADPDQRSPSIAQGNSGIRAKTTKLKQLKARYNSNAKSLKKAKKKYDEKRGKRVYKPSTAAVFFRKTRFVTQRRMNELNAKLQSHREGNRIMLPEVVLSTQLQLLQDENTLELLQRRQTLHKGMEKMFSVAEVKKKYVEGYETFEVVRDFVNAQDDDVRDLFRQCLTQINAPDLSFWDRILSDKAYWTQFFGIDEEFRVPCIDWQ